MRDKKETVVFFNTESIIEVTEQYLPNTVKVFYYEDNKAIPVNISEIGGKYLSILDDLKDGLELVITYKVQGTEERITFDKRLDELELKVKNQQILIEKLLVANRNRVDITTFNTWIRAVETKLGVELSSQSFPAPYP